ncbi:hypothetical protein B0H94_10412 [Salsuginibacillus halophilus]|uniref:SbsA Ig-like domain-containing protein n=1 Tax=Salsuginibacillus halophilus TaxID=517424 RepID=A0A2P8HQD5_9BACI|nr:hypothetical protein [Salsuginibacillus halophilus]PSL48412.1 hypothetical protein B0H94_10412 [Salsuginibacillus halophilus]
MKCVKGSMVLLFAGVVAGSSQAAAEEVAFEQDWKTLIDDRNLVEDADLPGNGEIEHMELFQDEILLTDGVPFGDSFITFVNPENGEVIDNFTVENPYDLLIFNQTVDDYIIFDGEEDSPYDYTLIYSAEGDKVTELKDAQFIDFYGENDQNILVNGGSGLEVRDFNDEVIHSYETEALFEFWSTDQHELNLVLENNMEPAIAEADNNLKPAIIAVDNNLEQQWEISDFPEGFADEPGDIRSIDASLENTAVIQNRENEFVTYDMDTGEFLTRLSDYSLGNGDDVVPMIVFDDRIHFVDESETSNVYVYDENLEYVDHHETEGTEIDLHHMYMEEANYQLISDYENENTKLINLSGEKEWTSEETLKYNRDDLSLAGSTLGDFAYSNFEFNNYENEIYLMGVDQPMTKVHEIDSAYFQWTAPMISSDGDRIFFLTNEEGETHLTGIERSTDDHDITPADHEWTIELSQSVDDHSVTESAIYIEDEAGERIEIDKETADQEILIQPADGVYAAGDYTLYVTDELRSENGTRLNEGAAHEFTVE